MVKEFYLLAVGIWGVPPRDFWSMHPVEFWWLYEAKTDANPVISDEEKWDNLYDKLGKERHG